MIDPICCDCCVAQFWKLLANSSTDNPQLYKTRSLFEQLRMNLWGSEDRRPLNTRMIYQWLWDNCDCTVCNQVHSEQLRSVLSWHIKKHTSLSPTYEWWHCLVLSRKCLTSSTCSLHLIADNLDPFYLSITSYCWAYTM